MIEKHSRMLDASKNNFKMYYSIMIKPKILTKSSIAVCTHNLLQFCVANDEALYSIIRRNCQELRRFFLPWKLSVIRKKSEANLRKIRAIFFYNIRLRAYRRFLLAARSFGKNGRILFITLGRLETVILSGVTTSS